MYHIKFHVDSLPDLPNARSQKSFWGLHNEKNTWTKYIALATIGKRPDSPLKKSKVTITRCSSRECDWDNLYSSFKAPLDALVRLGIIIDDRPSTCQLLGLWMKTPQKEAKLLIEIEEVTEEGITGP